ncbi:Arylsulfatase, partial [hydrothermal vent metagenome]
FTRDLKMKKSLIIGALLYPILSWSQSCDEQNIKLQVLGSGGPELSDGRVSSSHLIWVNGEAKILVDLGGGSAHQFEKTEGKLNDLDAILLTHLHVDHSADLPEFIKGFYFSERKKDLIVMGPAGNQRMPDTTDYIDQLFGSKGAYRYLNSYLNPEKNSYYKIKATNAPLDNRNINAKRLNDEVIIKSIAVNHGSIAAVAWRVEVGDCAITFSGDMTNKYTSLARLAQGSDLLVANNTIGESATDRAKNMHMPPSEIGKIATQARVKKLLLAHLMNSSLPHVDQTTELIKKTYQGPVLLAEDLMVIELD